MRLKTLSLHTVAGDRCHPKAQKLLPAGSKGKIFILVKPDVHCASCH
jgi:hypothetical protein